MHESKQGIFYPNFHKARSTVDFQKSLQNVSENRLV